MWILESGTEEVGDMTCREIAPDDATPSAAGWHSTNVKAKGEVISRTGISLNETALPIRPTATLHVLTDFELPLYSLHVTFSVLGLDGVTVTHELHELSGQDAVLVDKEPFWSLLTQFHLMLV